MGKWGGNSSSGAVTLRLSRLFLSSYVLLVLNMWCYIAHLRCRRQDGRLCCSFPPSWEQLLGSQHSGTSHPHWALHHAHHQVLTPPWWCQMYHWILYLQSIMSAYMRPFFQHFSEIALPLPYTTIKVIDVLQNLCKILIFQLWAWESPQKKCNSARREHLFLGISGSAAAACFREPPPHLLCHGSVATWLWHGEYWAPAWHPVCLFTL